MKHIFITTLTAALFLACQSEAEIAVRHSGTSENEFQALAQALGFTTVGELLTEKNQLSPEVSELFRHRLFEAQSEWLKKRAPFSAIDRFLELSLEADWNSIERQAFVIFFSRRLETELSSAKEEELFSRLSAFTSADDTADFSKMILGVRSKWESFLAREAGIANSRLPFPAGLPTDVSHVLLNGRPIARQTLSSLFLPRADVRVTWISNTYQPFTMRLTDRTTAWPTLARRAWLNDDCSINVLASFNSDIKMKVLGSARCERAKAENPTTISEGDQATAENQLSKFGLSQSLTPANEMPKSDGTTVLKKPWFWGALGVLALGAVIAVRAGDNRDATVQPTHNEGW